MPLRLSAMDRENIKIKERKKFIKRKRIFKEDRREGKEIKRKRNVDGVEEDKRE